MTSRDLEDRISRDYRRGVTKNDFFQFVAEELFKATRVRVRVRVRVKVRVKVART